jgi:hypothetical protein
LIVLLYFLYSFKISHPPHCLKWQGEWLKGKRHGLGRFIRPDGVVLFGRYEEGHHVGKGVRWSADVREAQIVENGVPKGKIDMTDAIKMKKELGFNDDLLP